MVSFKRWMRMGAAAILCIAVLCGGALADVEDLNDWADTSDWYEDDNGWYDEDDDWHDEDRIDNADLLAVPRFPDVPADASYAEAVDALADLGVITGKDTGLFDPSGYITRGEMATIMCRALDIVPSVNRSRFTDTAGHWAEGYIEATAYHGIINGDGTGNFRPNDQVTYEQVVKMIVCSSQSGEDYAMGHGGWPTGYLAAGLNLGLMDTLPSNTAVSAQRSTVAELIYSALQL